MTVEQTPVRVTVIGEDVVWDDGKGGSRPAELIESDLVSWLGDVYGMKNVKVTVEEIHQKGGKQNGG